MGGRHARTEWRLAGLGAVLAALGEGSHGERRTQIAEWRAYVANAPGVNGHDVDELEDHLRHQIAELTAAGLTPDEGLLIAVKRLGAVDGLSREFAGEHSGRLWKQLLLSGDNEPARPFSGLLEPLVFAVAAAVAIQVARLAAGFPDEGRPGLRGTPLCSCCRFGGVLRSPEATRPSALGADGGAPRTMALVVNLYPWGVESDTEALVVLSLPVALWFVVAYPYMGGTIRSHQRRMGFCASRANGSSSTS